MTEDIKTFEQRLMTQGRSDEPIVRDGAGWVVGAVIGAAMWAAIFIALGGAQ